MPFSGEVIMNIDYTLLFWLSKVLGWSASLHHWTVRNFTVAGWAIWAMGSHQGADDHEY